MSVIIADTAQSYLLNAQKAFLNTFTLRLFKNDLTPNGTTLIGAFVEATFAGYAPKPLNDWQDAFLNADFKGQIQCPVKTWTQTADIPACDVYGYYVTDPQGRIIYSERNPNGPDQMDSAGKKYNVVPRLTLYDA